MFTSHFVHTAGDEAMALIHVRQPLELQLELHVEELHQLMWNSCGTHTMNLGNSFVCYFFSQKTRNVITLPPY